MKPPSVRVSGGYDRAQARLARNDGPSRRDRTEEGPHGSFSSKSRDSAEDGLFGFISRDKGSLPSHNVLSTEEDGLPILASRGYIKLSNIIDFIKYDFRGKTVLDIGSSTGGFTALALDRGAKQVVAVEKGTNQMSSPLRFDPRIDLREKTDIFDVEKSTFPHLDTIVADVSFISLRPILTHAKNLAAKDTDFIIMLKPQFEARLADLNKGVVKNEKIRRRIIKDFEYWLTTHGFIIKSKRDNLLPGKSGNLERFYHLTLSNHK